MSDERAHVVGPWTLLDELGHGGNATVWRATRAHSEQVVALKVINAKKVEREPYKRFVREIEFLRSHPELPGLLPLLDAYLPDNPARSDQPWLAMPIATPIAAAVAATDLNAVVHAISVIADTLARLRRDFDVAHRDIKPGNLYELDGDWLIGDFGLIAVPNAESLTGEGRQIGPAHYTAYEMIINPADADPHSADVYSLGKTLWVLATGQAFPPEGNQPTGASTRGFAVGDFRPHPHAALLDHEVDLMTRLIPNERPSKQQVAIDLAAWRELASRPVTLDVSDAKARLRAKIATALSKQDVTERNKDSAHKAVRRLQELTAPLNAGLKELYERTQVDLSTDEMTQNLLKTHHPSYPRAVDFRWQRCTMVVPFDLPGGVALRMSRSLELFNDGDLVLHLMVHVGPQGLMGSDFHWQSGKLSAPVESLEAEKMLESGAHELTEALKQGVEVFVDRLPDVGTH